MKKVHFDKFGDGSICCGTSFVEYVTRDEAKVTCLKCRENFGFRMDEVPQWIISKVTRLFSGSASTNEPRNERDEVKRKAEQAKRELGL